MTVALKDVDDHALWSIDLAPSEDVSSPQKFAQRRW
jgi:hypothetical protein